jgi:hypothetical protein
MQVTVDPVDPIAHEPIAESARIWPIGSPSSGVASTIKYHCSEPVLYLLLLAAPDQCTYYYAFFSTQMHAQEGRQRELELSGTYFTVDSLITYMVMSGNMNASL